MTAPSDDKDADLGRPSDTALLASVASTLRDTVLPNVDDSHVRQVVIQLVGLASYAGSRGTDPTPRRLAELAEVLDELAARSPAVVAHWEPSAARDPASVLRAATAILTARIEGADPSVAEAAERIRSRLVAHLDADLATEAVLIDAFRGKLPDG